MQVCHFQHLLRQFDKNEPGRFLGEGVSFRAKLIGVLEVPEARGDRMCQEALSELKMAIRAAGEHKQRIQVHVAIDGLRLRDDKTGDSLYHHPVHKISFIAQDMTDSRAFGYIFGSPDTGHRFFGIKTDKAASQVVIAMRDLFQVVFELKKKEVEMAKQQLEAGKAVAIALHKHPAPAAIALSEKMKSMMSSEAAAKPDSGAEGGVAELVDLEQELSSLRRGLTQVEELTPSADPFGDSFIVPTSQSQKALLPPPPSGASTRGRNTPATARTVFSPNKQSTLPFDLAATSEFETPPTSLVDNNVPSEPPVSVGSVAPSSSSLSYDVFTDLDPLGTGKSKPYVDKKLFFQELKNPPKKVLKDLQISEPEKEYMPTTTMTSLTRHSGGSVAVKQSFFGVGFFASDPFEETDPFDNSDPFSESKEDPFKSMQEFPKRREAREIIRREIKRREDGYALVRENAKNVFNGPLQVSLPPEPAPRSPRLQRQIAIVKRKNVSSKARPRPRKPSSDSGGSCNWRETISPPPPLPPKKSVDISIARPPPRPPTDQEPEAEPAPPLPRPARKKEPMADRTTKPRLSSVATNSSEDEYLSPAPPPLPAARRFDITLSQLLTCNMDDLANRLRVPVGTLSSMTLPQLTDYLRSYLAADSDRARIHTFTQPEVANFSQSNHGLRFATYRAASPDQFEIPKLPSDQKEISRPVKPPKIPKIPTAPPPSEFKPQFEDNFTPPPESDAFEANFDDFDKKANASYDRYAAFREIQEEELKAMAVLDPLETKQDSDDKEELTAIDNIMQANIDLESEEKESSKSPLKSLDELTIDSFNMFRNSVSPKPSTTPIDAKIEDIKCVMKSLQIERSRGSVSPRDNGDVEIKQEGNNDRYAALREITITEPQEEFESLPPELPKERKKSDEKSDGFDNSDFFDCIDNSSLSFTHVEDAFRKSPIVKDREEKPDLPRLTPQLPEKKEVKLDPPVRSLQPQPMRLSAGSISDGGSGSSPDTKDKVVVSGCSSRWAVLGGPRSPASSDSSPRARRPPRHSHSQRNIQTSSSSRDVSPWDEDLPPVSRLPRPPSHHRDRDRESRHNSSGSRECLDSGSGREKDKIRDKRDRDLSRDSRESGRDPRDSGSGRDRRDSKERDHRDRRDRRSRERDSDTWERERTYSREQYRDSRSRERQKEYREKERDRHRKPRHSYDEEEDYSDGCGSGRSSSRDRWDRFRREAERNYGSLGWRDSRRRVDTRQRETTEDPRYSSTLGWAASRRSTRRDERERDTREERDARRRPRREEARRRDYRFSNDFSPREEDDKKRSYPLPADCNSSRFNMYPGTTQLSSRFAFEEDVPPTASPISASLRARDGDSPATRFRFDSDSISPRSMFEDDFTALSTPRGRTASIAEEEECEVPPLRNKPAPPPTHKDIKKSESINIFTRESDPFENDAFFACTTSDRAARRENWPGDFQGFENS